MLTSNRSKPFHTEDDILEDHHTDSQTKHPETRTLMELRTPPVMGPIYNAVKAHPGRVVPTPVCHGYLHSVADAGGKTYPTHAVYNVGGKTVLQPLPPPPPFYPVFKPTVTFMWLDASKGECFRLNFGRKEMFITGAELTLLTDLLLGRRNETSDSGGANQAVPKA